MVWSEPFTGKMMKGQFHRRRFDNFVTAHVGRKRTQRTQKKTQNRAFHIKFSAFLAYFRGYPILKKTE
jgi:hypothetical protein